MHNDLEFHTLTAEARQEIAQRFWDTVFQENHRPLKEAGMANAMAQLAAHPWLVHERVPKTAKRHQTQPFLHALINDKNPALVKFSMAHGACMHLRGFDDRTALLCLMEQPWEAPLDQAQAHLARLMVQAGARCDAVSNCGRDVFSVSSGQLPNALLEHFIAHGAPLDGFVQHHDTPTPSLSMAIDRRYRKVEERGFLASAEGNIVSLVRHGANVNSHNPFDLTTAPLAYALAHGAQDLADLLLRHGADVHLTDRQGRGFLHWAANRTSVSWLVNNGADVETRDKMGRTPLLHVLDGHLPVEYSKKFKFKPDEVVIGLMLAGADLEAREPTAAALSCREQIAAKEERYPAVHQAMLAMRARVAAMQSLEDICGPRP